MESESLTKSKTTVAVVGVGVRGLRRMAFQKHAHAAELLVAGLQ